MGTLLERTKRLLSRTDKTYEDIASSAEVSVRWLYMFAADEIPNPGVVTVQRLHDYLSQSSVPRRASTRVLAASKAE